MLIEARRCTRRQKILILFKEKRKRDMRKEIEDFMKVRECIKEKKKQQEFETSNNIEKIREDQERVNCKIKAVNNKVPMENIV